MKKILTCIICFLVFWTASPILADDIKTLPAGYYPYVAKKDEVIYSGSQYRINNFDPTAKTNKEGINMPGSRGTNQLIIYTSAYGKSTCTNEYGSEAIVIGNTVVELSGANSPIPPDGFVISGHGKAKNWINSTIKVGTKVYVDIEGEIIYTYDTSESYIYQAENKLEETEQIIQYYSKNNPQFESHAPGIYITDAKKYIKKAKRNPQSAKKNVALAIDAANDALRCTIPFNPDEMKGVWLRPYQRNAQEVKSTVKHLKSLGIDTVFLETFYHGRTIYPSKVMATNGFIPQNENFTGYDPLAAWSEECKKQKIKLHIWFETFYIGNENPQMNPQNILFLNPEWGNKIKKDTDSVYPSKAVTEHNGYFLDPANPDVKKFLTDLVEEIAETYHPDGINLDYIRYPQSVSEMNSWGFTKYARNEFKQKYSIDPADIHNSQEQLVNWGNYRRNAVTETVKNISEICRKNNIYLTAVIFPDRLSALTTKLQDWKEWSNTGIIDGITPLFLTCDSKTAANSINKVMAAINPNTKLYAGIFVTFIGGSSDDLIRQLHMAKKMNLGGVIIFDYAHITNKYNNTMTMFFCEDKEAAKIDEHKKKNKKTVTKVKKEKQEKKKKSRSKNTFSFT